MPFVHENVKVELFPGTPSPIVYLSENDVGDTLSFELVYKGQPANIPNGSVVKFKGIKKDGLGFTVNSSNVSGNVVSFIVSQDMTSCSGVVEAEISITLSNNKHGTCNVALIVEKNPHPDGIQDGSYPQIISEMMALVNQIEGDAETASNAANTAVAAKNSALEIQQDVHQYTASVIDDWLDDHPEATTTVQDGSITEAKLADSLKLATIKDYVTPQMYGAKGNGVADDTAAIQSAINSGHPVVFPEGTYKMFNSVDVSDKSRFYIDATKAMIDYMGNDYAFNFRYCRNCNFKFGYVYARNGGGINFIADDVNTWSQYINIEFDIFNVLTNCINATLTSNGQWINQFTITKGRFQGGQNAVNVETTNGNVSGWHFTNVGFEGVTNGINLICHSGLLNAYTLTNCRYAESFELLMKTTGNVEKLLFIGSIPIKSAILQLSENTTGHVISTFNRSTGTMISGNSANIVKGKLVKENRTDYFNTTGNYGSTTLDLTTFDSLEFPHMLLVNDRAINKIVLPNYAGIKNGMNDFYFVFTKVATLDDPFVIEQNGSVIKTITSNNNKIIHAVWNESINWRYFVETTV